MADEGNPLVNKLRKFGGIGIEGANRIEALQGLLKAAVTDNTAEIERLKIELGRAYRALHGFAHAHRKGRLLNDTAVGYHAPTIGAAARYVREQSLEGADYFIGKPVEVLHEALGND